MEENGHEQKRVSRPSGGETRGSINEIERSENKMCLLIQRFEMSDHNTLLISLTLLYCEVDHP